MYRVEDKYNCSEAEMYMLQARMEAVLHADDHENSLEGYRIVSLYFDDLCDSGLHDTVDGVNRRVKYRIRIYNDSLDVIKLEVKSKKDNRILKRSKNITRAQMERLMRGDCIEEEGSAEDPATLFNLAIRTQGLRPRVIVAYERKAYVYEPGNVRITFDRNVRASGRVEDFGQKKSVMSFCGSMIRYWK